MIVLYNGNERLPLSVYEDFHVVHKFDGNDELFFSVPVQDHQYPLIQEECRIEAAGNEWIVKKIYDSDISCELNLDSFRAEMFAGYNSGSNTLQTILASIVPDGWAVQGAAQVSIRRTIELDYCTPFDIVQRCASVFGVTYRWDILNKILNVIVPETLPISGEYLTDELNLRRLSYQGDTSNLATRLYAYGKDGLTMEGAVIDGQPYGLPYVDDNSYTDKIISTVWVDERYTDADSLYTDAKARLAQIASPVQAYTCDADDLARKSSEYSFLAFQMHRKVTLIDTQRSLRVVHQIVEYDEYPEEAERSVVTLSSVPPTIGSTQARRLEAAVETVTNTAQAELDRATALLTGGLGGNIVFHYDADGKPYEMLILDQPDEAAAVNVWRYNKNGWGFSANGVEGTYKLAATIDGGLVADFIKAGTLDCENIFVVNLTAGGVTLNGIMVSTYISPYDGTTWESRLSGGGLRLSKNNAYMDMRVVGDGDNVGVLFNGGTA